MLIFSFVKQEHLALWLMWYRVCFFFFSFEISLLLFVWGRTLSTCTCKIERRWSNAKYKKMMCCWIFVWCVYFVRCQAQTFHLKVYMFPQKRPNRFFFPLFPRWRQWINWFDRGLNVFARRSNAIVCSYKAHTHTHFRLEKFCLRSFYLRTDWWKNDFFSSNSVVTYFLLASVCLNLEFTEM